VRGRDYSRWPVRYQQRGENKESSRRERCLVKQFARTDTRKNSFAVDSWNEMPESVPVRAEEKLTTLPRGSPKAWQHIHMLQAERKWRKGYRQKKITREQ
jgi:hypothetical protein